MKKDHIFQSVWMWIKSTSKALFGWLPVNSTVSLNKLIQYNEIDHADDSGDLYNAQDLSKGYTAAGSEYWNNLCEDLQQVLFNTDWVNYLHMLIHTWIFYFYFLVYIVLCGICVSLEDSYSGYKSCLHAVSVSPTPKN